MVTAILYLECSAVGAGIGGGFSNTNELKVMKYNQAVNGPEGEIWKAEIINEHSRMIKNKVFTVVRKCDLPPRTRLIGSTWVCKKKSNGTHRGRLIALGYIQQDGEHYAASSISVPVTGPVTIHITMPVVIIAKDWVMEVVDVKGAFLCGTFKEGEKIYM